MLREVYKHAMHAGKHYGRGGKSMTDHVIVDQQLMKGVGDMTMQREAGNGISDHFLLLTKLIVLGK